MNSSAWNCLVIDAGARYGLHPSWREARDLCEFHLFEPEPIEAKRLQIRYQELENISVHQKALAEKNATRQLILRGHLGLATLEDYDLNPSDSHPDFKDLMIEIGRIEVEAVNIDDFFLAERVDFLKLDAEGSDREILAGATSQLSKSILGIRVNVDFHLQNKSGYTFSDIDIWLRKFNFHLQNIEIDTRVAKRQGLFPLKTISGSLIGGDAIWVRSSLNVAESKNIEKITLYALFLYLNSLEDVGLQFLVDAVTHVDLQFEFAKSNKFVYLLETKIMSHLASALASGWWDSKQIFETYTKIFKKEFPTKEELYLRLCP
jgi:FkbM family methyltransferase